MLICVGEKDFYISLQQISAFKQEMKKADANYKIIVYKKAKHSFANPMADSYAERFSMPVAYNSEADSKSWNDVKKFLKTIF
jgi:dienelactone hydrolase